MRGIDVILYEHVSTGTDSFNNPVFDAVPVTVHDVLVGQPSAEEVLSSINLHGVKIEYVLALPKGDAHNWIGAEVEFFGQKFKTVGGVVEGIEANVPTRWHKQVRVARNG